MRARVALCFLLLAASGCSSLQGAPQRAFDPDADLAAIQSTIAPTAVAECLSRSGAAEECRNRIVTARKYAIDVRFSEFEQAYFTENRWAGFGATLAALGLGAAGSLSGAGTAQALAAAAAGVTGSRAAYEREILAERTLLTIDNAMHAQRDMIALGIRDGLTKNARDYPLGTALSDLDAYYRAGTIVGAMTTVTQTIGAQAEGAQTELRAVLPLTRTSAARYLQDRFRAGDAALIRAQMREAGISDVITVPRFVRTGSPPQLQAVARALGWNSGSDDSMLTEPQQPAPFVPGVRPTVRRPLAPVPGSSTTVTPTPTVGSLTARQFLRNLNEVPGNKQRIEQGMQALGMSRQMTAEQFISTATRQQLESVARPFGWTP